MDPGKDREAGDVSAIEGKERRRSSRYPCGRLVVIRLPGEDGTWRWHWVTDVSSGGVAVSFLAGPATEDLVETTLLDVDAALSFAVSVRPVWHNGGPSTRTGLAFLRTDPGVARWAEGFSREASPRAGGEQEPSLLGTD